MVLGTIHPLETDGVSSMLFEQLAKENKALSSARVWVPSTVLFEQGFAKAWYYSEKVTRPDESGGKQKYAEVKKRTGKECDVESIKQSMLKGCKDGEICAQFLSINGREQLEKTEVTYMTPSMLRDFLSSQVQKPRGLLQKFVNPKGQNNNVIIATWSPCLLVTELRRNRHCLFDRHVDVNKRASTFECKSDHCSTSNVGEGVTALVKEYCEALVSHFLSTEHLCIVRMVLYFKVDCSSKLRLLFSSSIRIVETKNTSKDISFPVNLSVRLVANELKTERRDDSRALNRRPSLPADLGPLIAHEAKRLKNVRKMRGCDIEFYGERGRPYSPLRKSPQMSPAPQPVSPTITTPATAPAPGMGNRPRPLQQLQNAVQTVSSFMRVNSRMSTNASPSKNETSFNSDLTGSGGNNSFGSTAGGWGGDVRLTPVTHTPKSPELGDRFLGGGMMTRGGSPNAALSPQKQMRGPSHDPAVRKADWGDWLQRNKTPTPDGGSRSKGSPPPPALRSNLSSAAVNKNPLRGQGIICVPSGVSFASPVAGPRKSADPAGAGAKRQVSDAAPAPVESNADANAHVNHNANGAQETPPLGGAPPLSPPEAPAEPVAAACDGSPPGSPEDVEASRTGSRSPQTQVVSPLKTGGEDGISMQNQFVYYYGAGKEVYMNRKMDAGAAATPMSTTPTNADRHDSHPRSVQDGGSAAGSTDGAKAAGRRASTPTLIEQEEREQRQKREDEKREQRQAAKEKRDTVQKKRLFMQQQMADKLPGDVVDIPGPDQSILLTHPMFHPKAGAVEGASKRPAPAPLSGGLDPKLLDMVTTQNCRVTPLKANARNPKIKNGAANGNEWRFSSHPDADQFHVVTPLDNAVGIFVHQRTPVKSAAPKGFPAAAAAAAPPPNPATDDPPRKAAPAKPPSGKPAPPASNPPAAAAKQRAPSVAVVGVDEQRGRSPSRPVQRGSAVVVTSARPSVRESDAGPGRQASLTPGRGPAASPATPRDSDSEDGRQRGKDTGKDAIPLSRERTLSLEPPPPPPTKELINLRKEVTQYLGELIYVLYSALITGGGDLYIEPPETLPALTTDILMSILCRFSPQKVNTVEYCLSVAMEREGKKLLPPYCDSEDEDEPPSFIPWPLASTKPAKVRRKRDLSTMKRAQRLEKVQRRLDRISAYKRYVDDRVPGQRAVLLDRTSNDIMRQWRPAGPFPVAWHEPVEAPEEPDPDAGPPRPEDLLGPIVEGPEPCCEMINTHTGLVIRHSPGNVMVAKNGGSVDTQLDALFAPSGEIYHNVARHIHREALARQEVQEREANLLASMANVDADPSPQPELRA